MAGIDENPLAEEESSELSKRGVYETPRKALEDVGDYYKHWSGRLTETSMQMCYALIGANWVVFGSVGSILQNSWAKLSLLAVILTLAVNVIGAWGMSEALRRRFEYAEEDNDRWQREFNEAAGKRVTWPFTYGIESGAFWLRQIKGLMPIIGGAFLIIGAIGKK
jgi:hypothetical protein